MSLSCPLDQRSNKNQRFYYGTLYGDQIVRMGVTDRDAEVRVRLRRSDSISALRSPQIPRAGCRGLGLR